MLEIPNRVQNQLLKISAHVSIKPSVPSTPWKTKHIYVEHVIVYYIFQQFNVLMLILCTGQFA